MKPMTWFLVFACASWFAGTAQACSCAPELLDFAGVLRAKNVFIFHLVSARALPDRAGDVSGPQIEGTIEVVDWLRGQGKYRKMRFSTGRCCGSRFDVGTYFVGFVSERGPAFRAHFGNVVEIGTHHDVQEARKDIAAVLSGQRQLDDVFPRSVRERTEQSVVPLPCPRAQAEARE